MDFHGNPSSGSRVVLYGQTDGRKDKRDEANSRFSKFCERVLEEGECWLIVVEPGG